MSGSFSPVPGEISLVNAIFQQGDPDKRGILTGDVAVRIFGGAKLAPQVLGEIWAIADEDNNGWLSKKNTAIAVRLMGHAQKGEKVTKSLLSRPGPLPNIEGISAVAPQATGSALKAPPPFTPADRSKFLALFQNAGPVNGLLSGEKARDIFIKSKLPNDKLLQIWNLADTQDRGSLDATDFAIGMYFIQATMSGSLSFIPTTLPPGLYQQASGAPPSIISHSTGGSNSNFSPSPITSSFPHRVQTHNTGQPLAPQYSGYGRPTPPQLPVRPSPGSAVGASAFGHAQVSTHWDITPAEKASSDNFFNNLDTGHHGYIEGDVAVPFMLESKLPEDDLALIWDLADINNDGRLTKDNFAVAMHLIQNKLKGVPIPSTLPPTLVPPSHRQSPFSPAPSQLVHQQPPPPAPASDLQDLLWDEPVQPPPAPQTPANALNNIPAQTTGGASAMLPSQNTGGAASALAPQTTGPMSRQFTGQAPSPQPTAFSSPPRQDPFGSSFTSPSKNFLDDDDEPPAPIEDKSAEIGNVQNQLNSTNKSLETVKAERAVAENQAANQAGQLAALQTQLSSAKAAFDAESKHLASFKERFNSQTSEINKVREELIRAESDLSALKVEKAEIEGTFMRDKEEHRDLNRKVIEAGQQVEGLKAEVEKLKKDAKQQKGRLAIARKQLSTKEAEKAKVQKELDEAKQELASASKEAEDLEAELAKPDTSAAPASLPSPERALSADSLIFAASQPLPGTPDIGATSPAQSAKSNNPFERLAMSSGPNSRSSSPFQMVSPMDASISSLPSNGDISHEEKQPEAPLDFASAFEDPAPVPAVVSPAVVPNGDSAPATPKAASPFAIAVPETTTTAEPTDNDATNFVSPTTTGSSDQFATPPSTANPDGPQGERSMSDAQKLFPDLELDATKETSTPQPSGQFPGAFPSDFSAPAAASTNDKDAEHTDLNSNLKELEVDESDSSDDDEDVPLSTIAEKAKEANGTAVPKPEGTTSDFNDIFKVTSDPAPAPTANGHDPFGFPAPKASSPFDTNDNLFETTLEPKPISPAASSPVAGADVFDEAMGIAKGKSSSGPTQLSFDDAFDASFDFGGTSFSPAPAEVNGTAPTANGVPEPAKPATPFDDIFNTPPANNTEAKPDVLSASTTSQASAAASSFDAAFGSFDTAPTPDLSLSQSSIPPASVPSSQTVTTSASAPFPPGPASPGTDTSPRPSKGSSTSHRPSSPPPRSMSPSIRSTTTQSPKDSIEKHKETHTRSSKLSIRLPFGRKKKDKAEPMPALHSSTLSPPIEMPLRESSPAVDDDVEPVKQLTAMGFSRTQAVAALEKYSYDVPRALNSLLGQQ